MDKTDGIQRERTSTVPYWVRITDRGVDEDVMGQLKMRRAKRMRSERTSGDDVVVDLIVVWLRDESVSFAIEVKICEMAYDKRGTNNTLAIVNYPSRPLYSYLTRSCVLPKAVHHYSPGLNRVPGDVTTDVALGIIGMLEQKARRMLDRITHKIGMCGCSRES